MSVGMPGTSTRSSVLPQRDFFARGLFEEAESKTKRASDGESDEASSGAGTNGVRLGEDGFVSLGELDPNEAL